jgi:oligopeptide/dipeptide ABC transporter ATP-binding protein
MLITHDLGVVAGMTEEIVVMYAGRIFERALTTELFARSGNPYTKALLRSVPGPMARGKRLFQIPGVPPDLARLGAGCPFAPRCDRVQSVCLKKDPPFVRLDERHYSLCHFASAVHDEVRSDA